MEELTESARQSLVSQGIILGTLSLLTSLGLLLTGIVVITRASDILHFTSLSHLAILEIVCGASSLLVVAYILWIVSAYRNRQLEIRSKYLDESISRGLVVLILPILITFSAFIVSAIFLMLKAESNSTYDLKSAMALYATDLTKKVIIDKLQIIFECCGSQSLLDWFLIDWQNSETEPGEHVENNISDWDSVPYSCCAPEAPPPCIHHQLKVFGVGSLFSEGCGDKLDAAVFAYVVMTLVMFCCLTFFMIFLMYSARKLQTSARSAVQKGDATATGTWWLLSPGGEGTESRHTEDSTPLLDNITGDESVDKISKDKKSGDVVSQYWCKGNNFVLKPFTLLQKSKIIDSTMHEDWETYKTGSKNVEESSEGWTRRAYDASGSTSTTSFLTTSVPVNSTPESRHSVSDTAVANLEVSHHFEHKVRPLYRT